MKLFIRTIIILFSVQLQAQINLITPSSSNDYLWINAEIDNRQGVTLEKHHENDDELSQIIFNEIVPNWICEGYSCAVEKTNVKTMSLAYFNRYYQDESINFSTLKYIFNDPVNQCGNINDYLEKRDNKITYFVVEGNFVKVYTKVSCGVIESNDY